MLIFLHPHLETNILPLFGLCVSFCSITGRSRQFGGLKVFGVVMALNKPNVLDYPPSSGHKCTLLGIEIDNLTVQQFLHRLSEFVNTPETNHIAYVNIDCLNIAQADKSYARILRDADLVYPDGMGVVFASWIFGRPLKERVNAGDLLPEFCRMCVKRGYRIYILGGDEGVASSAAENLCRDFPGLRIVGTHTGFFEDSDSEAIISDINACEVDVLMVGMGAPRQENWIRRHKDKIEVPVAWGVGALFDYYSLKLPRAPVWMRKIGLEWLFRLIVEPRRLWKRYLLGNFLFTFRVAFLVICDIVGGTLSWLWAYSLRSNMYDINMVFDKPLNSIDGYITALPAILVIWIFVCAMMGLYRRRRDLSRVEEMGGIIKATFFFAVSSMAVAFLLKELDLGRSVIGFSIMINFLLLAFTRVIFHSYEDWQFQSGVGRVRSLIVGSGQVAQNVRVRLMEHPVHDHDVVGIVDDAVSAENRLSGAQRVGSIEELPKLVRTLSIDQVFFAKPEMDKKEILNLVLECGEESGNCKFTVVSDMFEVLADQVEVEEVDDIPVNVLGSGKRGHEYEIIKRAFDLVLAIILLIPFSFLLPVIWLLVKLKSKGPVIFRQERIGRSGKHFIMYKFRTMHMNVNDYEEAPITPSDPRIIGWVGRMLRRTSLDEMPQLVNVLLGQMSMVGPRPEMPFIVDSYEKWQRHRLTVKPGITGLWQILGRKDLPLHSNLEYDFYYIRNQSFLFDLSILLKTIPVVLFGKGAY
jgi:exopolysaccharide biosynthesis polyprenyl glycosylphosphotransferase